jgi:hypothetical protein
LARFDAFGVSGGQPCFKRASNGIQRVPERRHPLAATDFDFFFGSWRVAHRRLVSRLAGSDIWQEFDGRCNAWPLMNGLGNIDDNVVNIPSGSYRAVTLRAFDLNTKDWAIWWLDGRTPHTLDVPVKGRFENGTGAFYAEDVFEGRPIKVRFLWRETQSSSPLWEQAFSPDGGATWETNWTMQFFPVI